MSFSSCFNSQIGLKTQKCQSLGLQGLRSLKTQVLRWNPLKFGRHLIKLGGCLSLNWEPSSI
jgi:hypothetical protein